MKNLDKYLSLLGAEVDGLLLTSRYSRHYGAEFDIAEGVAIVTAKGCRYYTDSRYIESAENNLKGFEVLMVDRDHSYVKLLNEAIADFGVTVLGYEENYLTVAELMGYEKNLKARTADPAGCSALRRPPENRKAAGSHPLPAEFRHPYYRASIP